MTGVPPLDDLLPLLGPRAKALEQVWLLGSKDDRNEIDVVVELLRRQASTDRSVLLRPPESDAADGPIRLGRVRHGRRELGWMGITEREVTQHIAVTGRSGCGKSTLCLNILLSLLIRGIPWCVFDYKRSARALRGLLEGRSVQVLTLGRDIGATPAFNIMVPAPGVPVDAHQRQLTELCSSVWFCGDGVISLLERAMTQCYAEAAPAFPTIADVARVVDELPAKSREIMWKTSAQRILNQMTTGQLGRILNGRHDAGVLELLRKGHTVIELDGLATADANFLTQHIVRWLTQSLLAEPVREELRMVVLVEEAHHLLAKHEGGRETVLETALREGREVGLGIVLADQSISSVSSNAIANVFTMVCMNARHRADVSAAAGALLLDDTQRDMLGTLGVGEAVVRLSDRWPWPVHIAVPALNLPKGSVTDLDLKLAFLDGPFAAWRGPTGDSTGSGHSAVHSDPAAQAEEVSAVPLADTTSTTTDSSPIPKPQSIQSSIPTSEPPRVEPRQPVRSQPLASSGRAAALAHRVTDLSFSALPGPDDDPLSSDGELRLLLEHIARFPLVGVAARFDDLGFSRRKGDALKKALIELHLATQVDVPIPTGKVVLLALTKDARDWLDRHRIPIAPLSGSLGHAYWQHHVAELLAKRGWDVTLEQVLDGHAVDVCARRDGRRLLIEIETGRSDWLMNLSWLESQKSAERAMLWLSPESLLKIRAQVPASVALLQPAGLDKWTRGR